MISKDNHSKKTNRKPVTSMLSVFLAVILGFMSCVAGIGTTAEAAAKKPTKIVLNETSASTSVGCTLKLKVKSVTPKQASKSVTWTSSNKTIATVAADGTVKGKRTGTAVITAKSKVDSKVKAKCKVRVYKATKTLKLNSEKSYTLKVGKTVKLEAAVTNPAKGAQPVQWSSQNPKIAKISAKGTVKAVAAGETYMVGQSGSKKVKVKITVKGASPTPTDSATIELYAIDEVYEEYISIPSGYRQNYDLSGHEYKIISGESIEIKNNVAAPKKTVKYYHQVPDSGFWVSTDTPSGVEGEICKVNYTYEDTVVQLDGGSTVTFQVVDYPKLYSENTMDTYLAQKIKSGMTDYEKAELCCKFVASYDYSVDFTTYVGLIVAGGGDCWASSHTLIYMLQKLGISCQSRDASSDQGAGSGHVNVIAKLDGKYYILDAGFNEEAPRTYRLEEHSTQYAYSITSENTIAIKAFMNLEGQTEITIPSKIDGYTVTEIGSGAFSAQHDLVKVTIPNTVKTIGGKAFYQTDSLKQITIPSSVESLGELCFCGSGLTSIKIPATLTEIGENCFLYCDSLKKIQVADSHTKYSSQDGVLFDKNKTTLLCYPGGKCGESYTVPKSVKTIHAWAFAGTYLKEVTLPAGLETIESRAFYMVKISGTLKIPKNIVSIVPYAFYAAQISKVVLPDSLKRIEDYAFYRADISEVNFPKNLQYIGEGAFAGDKFLYYSKIPASVTEIGASAFELDYGWSSLGETTQETTYDNYIVFDKNCKASVGEDAFSGVMLGVIKGSAMHQYAVKNNCPYQVLSNGVLKLKEADVTLEPGDGNIQLTWEAAYLGGWGFTDNSGKHVFVQREPMNKTVSYEVYRKKGAKGTYKKVATLKGKNTWKDTDVKNGTAYRYKIYTKVNGVTLSTPEQSIGYVQSPKLASVTGSIGYSYGYVSVAWNTVSGADEYKVYRRLIGETEWSGAAIVPAASGKQMNYSMTLSDSTNYEFWVTACKGDYESAPSAVKAPQYKSGENYFKVTKAGAAAAITGTESTKSAITIPAKVTLGGITYKVTSIGANAFKNNKNITKVTLGKNIASIENNAFSGCKKLKSIILGTGVKKIGKGAFKGDVKLAAITIKSKKLTSVGKNAFKGIKSTARIKVPASRLEKYRKLLKGKGQGSKVKIVK